MKETGKLRAGLALLWAIQFGKINPIPEARKKPIVHEFGQGNASYTDFENMDQEDYHIYTTEELDEMLRDEPRTYYETSTTQSATSPEPPTDDAFKMIRGRGYLDIAQRNIKQASELSSGMSRNYLINQALSNLDLMYMEMKDSGVSLPISLGNKLLKLSRDLSRAGLLTQAELSRNIAIKYFQ